MSDRASLTSLSMLADIKVLAYNKEMICNPFLSKFSEPVDENHFKERGTKDLLLKHSQNFLRTQLQLNLHLYHLDCTIASVISYISLMVCDSFTKKILRQS